MATASQETADWIAAAMAGKKVKPGAKVAKVEKDRPGPPSLRQDGQDGDGNAGVTVRSEVWPKGTTAQLRTRLKGGGWQAGQPLPHPDSHRGTPCGSRREEWSGRENTGWPW